MRVYALFDECTCDMVTGETTRCVSYEEELGDWSLTCRTSEPLLPQCRRPKKPKCVKIVDLDLRRAISRD